MDKLMMNKLDDMELDMVTGGKKDPRDGYENDEDPLHRFGRKINNAVENGVKAVVNGARNAFDNLLSKVFGPPRKR